MIIHLLSLIGSFICCIVFSLMEIFAPNPSGLALWPFALGFLVLFFLVYWNLHIDLKKG